MNRTEQLLDELNLKIRHLTSSQLRSESLLELLNIELKKAQEINIEDAMKDTVAMVDLMNKADSIVPISFCIYLLEQFRQTNNFDVIALPTQNTNKELEKFNHLKSKLSEIVIRESDEPTFQ